MFTDHGDGGGDRIATHREAATVTAGCAGETALERKLSRLDVSARQALPAPQQQRQGSQRGPQAIGQRRASLERLPAGLEGEFARLTHDCTRS